MAPRSDARYSVPRRRLPASSTGWNPISSPRSKRYPSGPGAAGTASPATPAGYAANTCPPLSYRTAATMCGSARRAERSSLASASLAKASEAVLLAAMIRPRTDRASRVACRSDQYWYPANAAAVSSRTSPLIDTSMTVSFCLIGQSRSDISTPRRGNDLGHAQQLGADRQVCRFRRFRVDLEPDTAPVSHEANHASPLGEPVAAENPDDQRRLRVRNGLRRPIDELREVEQEDGLHLSLGGPRRLRPQTRGAYQQHSGGDPQKCHATAPYTPRWMSRRVGLVAAPNSR